jgi:hypothetical protein
MMCIYIMQEIMKVLDVVTDDRPTPRDPTGDPTASGSGRPPPRARTPRQPWDDLGTLDDPFEDDASAPRGRLRWLIVAAVVPWVILAVVLVTGRLSPVGGDVAADGPMATKAPPPSPATGSPGTPAPSVAPTTGEAATIGGAHTATATLIATGARTSPRVADAVGMAVTVARAHLSTLPTALTIEGVPPADDADRVYVEHLAVEAIDHPGPDLVVVTLVAVVLPTDADSYGPAESRRLGVPIRLDGRSVTPAGVPWPLPAPRLVADPPTPEPLDDPHVLDSARQALQAAGYRDLTITAVGATTSWPLVADVEATAPSEDRPRRRTVWLRPDAAGLVVAGWLPADEPAEASPADPTAPPPVGGAES